MIMKFSEIKNYPQLKNWILTKDVITGTHFLYGEIYNDPRYSEGYQIPKESNRIIDINDNGFEYFIITESNTYACDIKNFSEYNTYKVTDTYKDLYK